MLSFSGILQVNLSAVRKNWQLLNARYLGADCGAVVKANAYGLGVEPISKALLEVGCQTFFVANYSEGLQLRRLMPDAVDIYVLQGCCAGMESLFVEKGLIPVIISVEMYQRWLCTMRETQLASIPRCALKVNTGMNRLGMTPDQLAEISKQVEHLKQAGVELLLSHLACADEPDHALNLYQLSLFESSLALIKKALPNIKASLVNSSGIFLGASWQFDIARPGIAVYGGMLPAVEVPEFSPVVSLLLPVLQVRHLGVGEFVGYDGTFQAPRNMRVAVVSGGYGDGILRSLSGISFGWFNHKIPLLGRVSMDSCVFDITDLSVNESPQEGDLIELIGEHCPISQVALQAGTISYELFCRLGERLEKRYCE